MANLWTYLNPLLFGVLPYLSLIVFFPMTIMRYRRRSFSYSSLSSQFLENRLHFWAVVPFHYGILAVLAGHIAAFLLPRQLMLWNSEPVRLFVLEATGLVFGLLTLVGLAASILRRIIVTKVNRVTSTADWIVYAMLLFQVISGIAIALVYPWGSTWFSAIATPYCWSVMKLRPMVDLVAPMPWLVKLHLVNAFLVIGFFPFTRLVHVLVVPNPYLWRKTQVARWYQRAVDIAHS